MKFNLSRSYSIDEFIEEAQKSNPRKMTKNEQQSQFTAIPPPEFNATSSRDDLIREINRFRSLYTDALLENEKLKSRLQEETESRRKFRNLTYDFTNYRFGTNCFISFAAPLLFCAFGLDFQNIHLLSFDFWFTFFVVFLVSVVLRFFIICFCYLDFTGALNQEIVQKSKTPTRFLLLLGAFLCTVLMKS